MIVRNALKAMRARADRSNVVIETLGPREAMDFILDWHASERFADAYPLNEDGDGVLTQWGTYGWGAPPTFQFNVARQLTTAQGWFDRLLRRRPADPSLWQVSLTLHYAPGPDTEGVRGSMWVFDPAEAEAARGEVLRRGVIDLLEGRELLRVEASFDQV